MMLIVSVKLNTWTLLYRSDIESTHTCTYNGTHRKLYTNVSSNVYMYSSTLYINTIGYKMKGSFINSSTSCMYGDISCTKQNTLQHASSGMCS